MDFEKLKLIIWDLDDTFWEGTISELTNRSIPENIQLIYTLTDNGIINTICSKNDEGTINKELNRLELNNYFVFNSIDYTPKGQRISNILKQIGLRAENTLFIDDNITNLKEAKFYEPQLHITGPEIIPLLIDYFKDKIPSDTKHCRLNQYKILEKKKDVQKTFSNNLDFLLNSNTRVTIKYDCFNHIDRIYELICRTNQLNYTKLRNTKDELISIINNKNIKSGYVEVNDRYGEYGIVGFFSIKNNIAIHFLFSCRTIGQGVEQYVYSILNYPQININGTVITELRHIPAPTWINQSNIRRNDKSNKISTNGKILFKGPCDLSQMVFNYDSKSIITEFTYIGNKTYNSIEHHNHSINYIQFPFLNEEEQNKLIDECIFNDKEMFKSAIYDKDISLIFLSTLIESNLALYKRKSDGFVIAFGEWPNDLTDKKNFDKFINGDLHTYNNKYTLEWLESFSNTWEYLGPQTPKQYIQNIETLLKKINPKAKICLILGSETPYIANKFKTYENRDRVHKQFNDALKKFAQTSNRVLLLDINKFIHNQNDFTNNIDHFQRRVYYELSQEANKFIEETLGGKLQYKNQIKKFFEYYIPRIKGYIYNISPSFIQKIWENIKFLFIRL